VNWLEHIQDLINEALSSLARIAAALERIADRLDSGDK
jgi:hypothetical protein